MSTTAAPQRTSYGLLLGLPMAALVLLGVWSYREIHGLQVQLASRPPIAVLPIDKLLTANGSTQADVEQQAKRVRDMVETLKDRGYIVMDDHRLVAYPHAVEIQP